MKILITGHHGLIGSALYKILSVDHEVFGFDLEDDFPYGRQFDLIIHTAAHCSIREVIKKPDLARENMTFTHTVYEFARDVKAKVIVFSSARVAHEVFNPYTVSKRYNEMMAKAYHDCYGIDSIIIRPETVWGLSNNNERAVIRWIQAARQNKELVIFGDQQKELCPIYIDDFVKFFLKIMNHFDEYVNQTLQISGQIRKAEDLADAIIAETHSQSGISFTAPEKTQPQECIEGDFVSAVPFEVSLKDFLCRLSQQS